MGCGTSMKPGVPKKGTKFNVTNGDIISATYVGDWSTAKSKNPNFAKGEMYFIYGAYMIVFGSSKGGHLNIYCVEAEEMDHSIPKRGWQKGSLHFGTMVNYDAYPKYRNSSLVMTTGSVTDCDLEITEFTGVAIATTRIADPIPSNIQIKCACGQFRIKTDSMPWCMVKCHCGDCREQGNNAPIFWVGYYDDDVKLPKNTDIIQKFGNRFNCKSCGDRMGMTYNDGYTYLNPQRSIPVKTRLDGTFRELITRNAEGNGDIVAAHIFAKYDPSGKKGTDVPYPPGYEKMHIQPKCHFGPYGKNIQYGAVQE